MPHPPAPPTATHPVQSAVTFLTLLLADIIPTQPALTFRLLESTSASFLGDVHKILNHFALLNINVPASPAVIDVMWEKWLAASIKPTPLIPSADTLMA
jgi:hypothetical protein